MDIREAAKSLGIETWPEALHEFCAEEGPACDLEVLDMLQKQWKLLGDYYGLVRRTAEELNADPVRSTWVKAAAAYARKNPTAHAKKVPVPPSDGTAATDLLPLYILLSLVPDGIREYERRGFSREEIAALMEDFGDSLRILETQLGRPAVNALYYGWLMHYVKAEIFRAGGFWFELKTVPPDALWLRSRQCGTIRCIMCTGSFDSVDREAVGSKNYEAPESTFTVSFEEHDDKFRGHGVYQDRVSPLKMTYSKEHWQCVTRPGDPCLNLHIPRGADISTGALDQALARARELVAARFPEKPPMEVLCSSWLLDPRLGRLLGPDARITQFQERFVRHTVKSQGNGPFGYVFPQTGDYADLPEDTTLQRKLKKLYMDGGCIYGAIGLLK